MHYSRYRPCTTRGIVHALLAVSPVHCLRYRPWAVSGIAMRHRRSLHALPAVPRCTMDGFVHAVSAVPPCTIDGVMDALSGERSMHHPRSLDGLSTAWGWAVGGASLGAETRSGRPAQARPPWGGVSLVQLGPPLTELSAVFSKASAQDTAACRRSSEQMLVPRRHASPATRLLAPAPMFSYTDW
jgi:hypothetical protein